MVRNHENPGLPESSNTHNGENFSNTPEWRPPHQVGNGNSEKSSLGHELDIQIGNEFPPALKSSAEGPNSFTTKTTGYWPVSPERAKAEKGEAVAKMERRG